MSEEIPPNPQLSARHALPCKLPRLAVQTEPEARAQLFLLVLRVTKRPQERPGRPLDDRWAGLLERGRPTLPRSPFPFLALALPLSLSRLCPMSPFAVLPAPGLALALALSHALTLNHLLTHPRRVAPPHPPIARSRSSARTGRALSGRRASARTATLTHGTRGPTSCTSTSRRVRASPTRYRVAPTREP